MCWGCAVRLSPAIFPICIPYEQKKRGNQFYKRSSVPVASGSLHASCTGNWLPRAGGFSRTGVAHARGLRGHESYEMEQDGGAAVARRPRRRNPQDLATAGPVSTSTAVACRTSSPQPAGPRRHEPYVDLRHRRISAEPGHRRISEETERPRAELQEGCARRGGREWGGRQPLRVTVVARSPAEARWRCESEWTPGVGERRDLRREVDPHRARLVGAGHCRISAARGA